MRRVAGLLLAVLVASSLPNQAVARDLAIWDKLQGKNTKGLCVVDASCFGAWRGRSIEL